VKKMVMNVRIGLEERVNPRNRFQAGRCLRAEISKGLEEIIIVNNQTL